MNDLGDYGLVEGEVLADLEDLLNLVGNPFPSPEEDDSIGVAGAPPNKVQEKMEPPSNGGSGDPNDPNNQNNSNNQNNQNNQDTQGNSGTSNGQSGNSDNQNGGTAGGQGEGTDNQNDGSSGQGGDTGNANNGSTGLHDLLKNMCDGKGATKNNQNSGDTNNNGGQQGNEGGQQGGQQGGEGGQQGGDGGNDGEGGGQSGGNSGGTQGGTGGTDGGTQGGTQGGTNGGTQGGTGGQPGNTQGGQQGGSFGGGNRAQGNKPEHGKLDNTLGSHFGADLGESDADFAKRMLANQNARTAGTGAGSGRKEVNFRGMTVDMDDYVRSNNADIIADDRGGEDVSQSKHAQAESRELMKQAAAEVARKEAILKQVQEDAKSPSYVREGRGQACARGKEGIKDLPTESTIDWRTWLAKRLSATRAYDDDVSYGSNQEGGLQAALMRGSDMQNIDGKFVHTGVRKRGPFHMVETYKKKKNSARVELFFDTSGSISDTDIAMFFREVAVIMSKCGCMVSDSLDRGKQWNDLIQLYIYCWDGSVLCNARVRSPEELMEIAHHTYGGGGTNPNCIFRFKQFDDGLLPLPPRNSGKTGVLYLDNMSPEEYKTYMKDREERLGHGNRNQKKAIESTITIVFTDYGFGAVDKDWLTKCRAWTKYSCKPGDTEGNSCNLMWVCLPGCVSGTDEMRRLTPFGCLCHMKSL